MKKIISVVAMLILLVGCSKAASKPPLTNTVHVATTLYPITYFVERIGGTLVTVTPIIENGADAHSYEPTIQQMQAATDSQLFLYVDESVESFMTKLIPTIESGEAKIIALSESVELYHEAGVGDSLTLRSGTLSTDISTPHIEEEHDDHEHSNNHIWLYPPYAKAIAQTILHELILLTPENETVLTENYAKLEAELIQLDEAFLELSAAPKPYFMVTHAAYGAWENYGLHQIPITGVLGNDEPTQQELIKLIETGSTLDLQYLFYEQNLPSGNGAVLEKELNLKPTQLYNLATITNAELKSGKDYFSLMYENLHNLKQEIYSE